MRHERPGAALVERRLARALTVSGQATGIALVVADHRARSWASATFMGALHRVTLVAPRSPALGRWVAALPEAELALVGHIVASAAVARIDDDGTAVTLTLDVLTIEDS